MKRFILYFFSILSFSLIGCNKQNKMEDREKKLAEKERLFAQKESEYNSLIKMRDSIRENQEFLNNSKEWPAKVKGRWNGKIICTESSCPGYAVGDLRNDIWEFRSDSLKKFVNVYGNNNQLIRTYNVDVQNNEILLRYNSDSTDSKKVEVNVVLNHISKNKIQGNRLVSINDCISKSSVELTRP